MGSKNILLSDPYFSVHWEILKKNYEFLRLKKEKIPLPQSDEDKYLEGQALNYLKRYGLFPKVIGLSELEAKPALRTIGINYKRPQMLNVLRDFVVREDIPEELFSKNEKDLKAFKSV